MICIVRLEPKVHYIHTRMQDYYRPSIFYLLLMYLFQMVWFSKALFLFTVHIGDVSYIMVVPPLGLREDALLRLSESLARKSHPKDQTTCLEIN